jgi:hypothetical protein
MSKYDPAPIRALNDDLRLHHRGGRIVATRGVHAHGLLFLAAVLDKLASPIVFNEDNDPYGEHDFGALTVSGVKLFWKIDYFDESLTSAAVDPADPSQCCRILTIMLVEEY